MTDLDLEEFRIQMGWSKREMAKRFGVTDHTVYNYLNGRTPIPGPVCKLIEEWTRKN